MKSKELTLLTRVNFQSAFIALKSLFSRCDMNKSRRELYVICCVNKEVRNIKVIELRKKRDQVLNLIVNIFVDSI